MKTFSAIAIATLTMVGVASAQQKAPEKAPAPAAPKADKAAPAPKPAAPAMPTPPGELDMMAKATVGTWKCKGDEWDEKGAKGAMNATSTAKLDLDKWWLVETMEAKGRMAFKMVSYTTYDPTAKKWRRLAMMHGGGQMIGTSDGMKDGKMTWNMDMMSPMGAGLFRDHVDTTDAKAGMKVWGEMSMDKGKTWNKVYEMACKK
jgi:hypothetical protein